MAAPKTSISPDAQVSARADTSLTRKRPTVDLSLVDARLDELFAAPEASQTANKVSARADTPTQSGPFRMLTHAQITVRPQVRQSFPSDEMAEIGASIRELRAQKGGIEGSGILQALLVTPESEGFRLIAGERRFRASQSEGVEMLPCVVVAPVPESAIRLLQLTENALRTPPPIGEEARAIQDAMTEDKLSIRDMARLLGKDKSYVEARVNLLKYPSDVQEMVSARADTLRHARHLANVQDNELRSQLIVAVRDEGIGEREVKRRIEVAGRTSSEGSPQDETTSGERENRPGEDGSGATRSDGTSAGAPSLRGALRATGEAIERLRLAVLSDDERQKARESRDKMRAMLDELDGILG